MSPDRFKERRAAFRALHHTGCFVLPNPWDAGSAVLLASMGFHALASTSSGHAWSHARADGQLSREETLAYLRSMVEATPLPVNADFEAGFGATPEDVAHSLRMAIDTGIAGISIEDASGNADAPLRDIADAVARMRAARAAIDASGQDVMLIGRAENFFVGVPDLDDTLARLRAYAAAGADVLYAPGIRTEEQIRAVVAAVSPKPVNVLISGNSSLTLHALEGMGVRRVSVGGAFARAALAGVFNAARGIIEDGRFDGFPDGPDGKTLNSLFRVRQPADDPA